MIELIILDVDGVLTDGRKFYDRSGAVISKTFCDKDWTVIKRFKALGIPVVFLTGDEYNRQILENRNLPVYVNRGKGFHSDKSNFLTEILTQYNATADKTLYVGDDLFDIGIMKLVGYPFCVADSPAMVQKYASRLISKGGENCLIELFEILEEEELIPRVSFDDIINIIYELDIKETF